MRSKALDKAMYELEKAMNVGNGAFRQFSESLRKDDIDEAYVLLDELISSFARITGMRWEFIAALYDEEKMKLAHRSRIRKKICGDAPCIYIPADLDRLINKEAEK